MIYAKEIKTSRGCTCICHPHQLGHRHGRKSLGLRVHLPPSPVGIGNACAHQQHRVAPQLQRAQPDERGPLLGEGVQSNRPRAHVFLPRDAQLLQLRHIRQLRN